MSDIKSCVIELMYHDSIEEKKLIVSNGAGFTTLPTDDPPNTVVYPRIKKTATIKTEMFSKSKPFGAASVGVGSLTLINNDGGLDFLSNVGVDGRKMVIRVGVEGQPYPSSFETMAICSMAGIDCGLELITIRLRDKTVELDNPLQTNKYLGDNIAPDGLEGTPDDIKDQPKPLVFGQVMNVTPIPVNSSKLIYQVHDGALADISSVYDRGAPLGKGANYSSIEQMMNEVPEAGQFRAYLTGGYFRLGSPPDGQVTANATAGNANACLAGSILTAMALRVGVDQIDIEAIDKINQEAPYQIGIYLSGTEVNALTAMNEIANSVSAWFGFNAAEQLTGGIVGSPVKGEIEIQKYRITGLERIGSDVPPHEIKLGYAKNYTQQNQDIAGVVTAERRAWLSESQRYISASDEKVKIKHLTSEILERNTLIVSEADAEIEVTRLASVFCQPHERLLVTSQMEQLSSLMDRLMIGNTISLRLDRYGYIDGKSFLITGYEVDYVKGQIELTLWG